jgi:hypothetical protein
MALITHDQVQSKIIDIRDQKVILDSDVAELYGVETRRINEAVRRNPKKFPNGYVLELNEKEWEKVRSQIAISPSPLGGGRSYKPKAFTERGLYMLATILKSPQAIETTIAIIDTFAKIKQLTQAVYKFSKAQADEEKVKIFENSTDIVADLLDSKLIVSQHETNFKIKLPFLELSRKITRVKK